jgi:hypothetical protein
MIARADRTRTGSRWFNGLITAHISSLDSIAKVDPNGGSILGIDVSKCKRVPSLSRGGHSFAKHFMLAFVGRSRIH